MSADFTEGRPLPTILKFSIPVIAGNLFQLLYTLADTVIVGQTMGEGALAAVGATTVFVYFILCFIQGMTNGFSIILGQRIGSRDESGARKSIAASVYKVRREKTCRLVLQDESGRDSISPAWKGNTIQ